MLDKEARVDFKRLYSLGIQFTPYSYESNKKSSSKSEFADQELFRGIIEVERELKDDVIDDLNLPIDLSFSYYEGEKLMGILPIYNEDIVVKFY